MAAGESEMVAVLIKTGEALAAAAVAALTARVAGLRWLRPRGRDRGIGVPAAR